MTHYVYPGGAHHTFSDARVVTMFHHQPSGVVRRRVDDKRQPTIEVSDRDHVDVSTNWEPIPTFGDWSSLRRLER